MGRWREGSRVDWIRDGTARHLDVAQEVVDALEDHELLLLDECAETWADDSPERIARKLADRPTREDGEDG